MVLRAEHEGPDAFKMMVNIATDLWRNFKLGSKDLKYWAASRESQQATRDELPGDNSPYAIMARNARKRDSVPK
jgi:hypothetical protein